VANSGIIGELTVLGHLLFPVGRMLWTNHGPSGDGHGRRQELSPDEAAARYPAFAAG
jgi:hypothetical protein